jgi:hypothetical protein
MKKLNLNFAINDLDGIELARANKLLAASLMAEKNGDAVKYFDWAMTLNKEGIIEVDESDFNKIKEIVEKTEAITLIVKAQILKYFSTLK